MKITPLTNAKGQIDYGHSWGYYRMGFIDLYGNRIPQDAEGEWEFIPNEEGGILWDDNPSQEL